MTDTILFGTMFDSSGQGHPLEGFCQAKKIFRENEKGQVLILDVVSYFCPPDNLASNGFISLLIPAC